MPQVNSWRREAFQSTVAAAELFACGFHAQGRGAAWVSPRGELDIASALEFKRILEEALDRALLVIVDLRALTFIDSSGAHAIIDADARAHQTGHRLVLIRGCGQIDRLFELTGLNDRLKTVDLTPDPASADTLRVVAVSGAAC